MEAKERLWLTADGKRLVGEGDPKAATLYAAPGDEIPDEAAARFGLEDGMLKRGKKPADKSKTAEGDKSKKPEGDKSAKTEEGGGQPGGLTVNKLPKG